MKNIILKVPNKNDLWFKKELKEDPNTMDYNKGYNVSFDGYDYNTGTIKTDLKELKNIWYKKWINNFPHNIYYYIVDVDKNCFIGEIYSKYFEDKDAYEIGILIKGEYRNQGYSTPSINILCKNLKSLGVKRLFHEVPSNRLSAIKADINNGFIIKKENYDGMEKFGKVEKLTYLEKEL